MRWTETIDAYCERLGPAYWAEPINAVTNAAFLIAAAVMWGRSRGLPVARLLCAILAVIGVGEHWADSRQAEETEDAAIQLALRAAVELVRGG